MILGKDFHINDNGTLSFEDNIIAPEPDVRRVSDALEVLYEKTEPSDQALYYMYRSVCFTQDQRIFIENNIRYDITVLVPGKVGKEYMKTVGHFHPGKDDSNDSFPEYYQVLSGEAIYLLQKNSCGEVAEVIAIEAKEGDCVYIPPNYGHVTINPGKEFLVMANLIESNFKSIYDSFRKKRGAAYYYVDGENGKNDWVKNTNYESSVALKVKAAPSLGQPVEKVKESGLYKAFINNPESFKFLK